MIVGSETHDGYIRVNRLHVAWAWMMDEKQRRLAKTEITTVDGRDAAAADNSKKRETMKTDPQ